MTDSPLPDSIIVPLVLAPPDEQPTVIGPMRSTSVDLGVGQQLSHFEIEEPIGRGGMATVFRARDLELGRTVALKILPPETARDPEAISRFKQEARAAALLNHESIARVYFCGEDRGLHFIAFEFVPGENLKQMIDSRGRLTPSDAVKYLSQLAGGLKHAAERGVVHRDIKPSNILITPEGHAKIVDMGLARHPNAAINGGVTQSGITLGTFDYISPEQALDPRRADVRSDIYSLGCTFYHALTGSPPVPDGTAARKLHAHQHEPPLDPRDRNPAVPEPLAAVLGRMMAKSPDRRYASADDLIADLQAVALACGMPVEGPVSEDAARRPVPSLPESRLPIPLPILLATAAVLIACAVLLLRPDPPSQPITPPWGEVATPGPPPEPAPLLNTTSAESATRTVASSQALLDALKEGGSITVKLRSGLIYDLTEPVSALVLTGTSITLESESSGPVAPILKLAAGTSESGPEARSLTFRECRSVTFRGLEIVIESPREGGDAVACTNVSRLSISGCRVRAYGLRSRTAFSVNATSTCDVSAQNSIFDLGSTAVAMRIGSGIRAEFLECAFGPHRAALDLDGNNSHAGELKLAQCTFLIDKGAAIRCAANSAMSITAGLCLFGSAETRPADDEIMPGETKLPRDIVLLVEGSSSKVSFHGVAQQPNGYYRVSPVAQGDKLHSFATVPPATFSDESARELTRSPWAVSDPRPLLHGSDPAAAFRLTLNDSKLRLPPATAAVILGAKTLGAAETRIYPGAWPPERPQMIKAELNERIVWPEAEPEDAALRLYPTFAAAYSALLPQETLTIAVNGSVPVPLLGEKALRATIRAAANHKPVLVPEGLAFTNDAVLFRLGEGELMFEGLEIHLKDRLAIVSVGGGTSCTFRRCVLSLTGRDGAVAIIPDPAREMRTSPGAEELPRVNFHDCLVRGHGLALRVQAGRAFEAGFENVGLALSGNLLVLDGPDKPLPETARSRLRLKHITSVLDEPLLHIKSGKGGTPAFLNVDADDCLFTSADLRSSTPPMIRLEDLEPGTDPGKLLTWSGRGSIWAYSDSAAAVDWQTTGETRGGAWDWPQWLRFTRDDDKHITRLRFARGGLKSKIASAEPADFSLSVANPLDAGVDVERLAQELK